MSVSGNLWIVVKDVKTVVVYDDETLMSIAHQAPLSMALSRQEYWSGLPCPPPEDLPDPGIKTFLCLLHWQTGSLQECHLGSPIISVICGI